MADRNRGNDGPGRSPSKYSLVWIVGCGLLGGVAGLVIAYVCFVGLIVAWVKTLPPDKASEYSQMPILGAFAAIFLGVPLGIAVGVWVSRRLVKA